MAEDISTPNSEIEDRGADNTGALDGRWRKTFVIFPKSDYEANKDSVHEKNKNVVVREAIANGLQPNGEPEFESEKDDADGQSIAVTYSVPIG